MAAKGFTLLFLAALASHAAALVLPSLGGRNIGHVHALAVGQPAEVTSSDNSGPFDHSASNAVHVAGHLRGRTNAVNPFIPPGAGEFLKQQLLKVAVDEGGRFAFAHPRETAEIVGIAKKVKALYDTVSHKLSELERKDSQTHSIL